MPVVYEKDVKARYQTVVSGDSLGGPVQRLPTLIHIGYHTIGVKLGLYAGSKGVNGEPSWNAKYCCANFF